MTTTITKKTKVKGGNMIQWNVERDGVPFGAIWTFKAAGEVHPFHAKTLAGNYQVFGTLEEAKDFMTTTRWWDAA